MLVLYALPASPPCRTVSLVLDVLGVEHEYKTINLRTDEHLSPEYLKINPQHNIPSIVDDDFTLNESRAIAVYLVQKYGKEKKNLLFPDDIKAQALVNQRLQFDSNVLLHNFVILFRNNVFKGSKDIPEDNQKKLKEAMGWLEDFLKPTGFVAGTNSMTVADLCMLATYSSMEQTKNVYVNLDDYPESKKWAENMKKLVPDYEKACGQGAADFGALFDSKTDF